MMDSINDGELGVEKQANPEASAIVTTLDAHIAALEQGGKENQGEVHTLSRARKDMVDMPYLAEGVDKHFRSLADAVNQRMKTVGQDLPRALREIKTIGGGALGITQDRSLMSMNGFGGKEGLMSFSLQSIPDIPGTHFKQSSLVDKGSGETVLMGAEIGADKTGTAFISPVVHEMILDAYLQPRNLGVSSESKPTA